MKNIKIKIEKIINEKKIKRNIEKEEAKTGNIVLKVEGINICSKYNIEKENERFFKINYEEEKDYFLIIGFGLGYHVEYFLKNIKKNQEIKVLILNPDIFNIYLEIIENKEYLKDEKLELIYGIEEEIIKKLSLLLKNKTKEGKIIINYPLLKLSKDYYPKIFDIVEKIDIDNKTIETYKDIIKINIEKNIEYIKKDKGIKEYKDLYKNKAIFTIAAGPSLNKNIEKLKKIKNRGIIIAVGTVLKILLKNNIKPDFIVLTDGLDNIYRQMEEYFDIDVPLLYIPGVNHKVIEGYKGDKIIAFPDEDLYFEKMEKQYQKGYISTGGSVATAAIDFARQLGGNPIIFVGQDLALGDDFSTHAEGTLLNNIKNNTNDFREIEGVGGKKIYTLKNLYHYLRWIENYIKKHNDIIFINTSEVGAFIKGTKGMKLEDVIESL